MPGQRAVPVIVGVAQATWRGGDAPNPIEMCAEVVSAAARDAGAGDALLRRAESLGVVDIASRRWNDPAALVAGRLGITPRETLRTTLGGDGPQALLSDVATRIAAGELAAYESPKRFYEIGSPTGLAELDQLLKNSTSTL